jgi:LysR family transcriptional regulator, glycine cleavage system transcriptional activator
MMTRWRDLPSLSALRAFDATARHGGFAGAGRALNVTHAAVIQQVRALEAELGMQLVRRMGRSVSLTDAGQKLAQTLGEGFGAIATGIADLQRIEIRKPLRVATTIFIAETRILPRLPDFWAQHRGVEVAMTPSEAVVDLVRDGYDLAVRAVADSSGPGPLEEFHPLERTPVMAVCAPSLLAGGSGDLRDLPWIIDPDNPWDQEQLRGTHLDIRTLQTVNLGSPHLEMSAGRRGLGVMLAPEAICRDDLSAGRLVRLDLEGLPWLTYTAVTLRGPKRPAVSQFVAWLTSIF